MDGWPEETPKTHRHNKSISYYRCDTVEDSHLLNQRHSNHEDRTHHEATNTSDEVTAISHSNDYLERSELSNISKDSLGRYSVRSLNSNAEDGISMGNDTLCFTSKISVEKNSSREFRYRENQVYSSKFDLNSSFFIQFFQ
jgi:hypothetical protein